MDINEMLNQIIFKYHIDQYYPHYRNMYEADKVIRNLVRTIIEDSTKALMIGNDETGLSIIRSMSRDYSDIHFECYNQDENSLERLDICWKHYDKIYLTSYHGAEYAERWFRMNHIKYEWIYDIFERNGIYLQRVFYILGKEDLHGLVIADYKDHRMRAGLTESIYCELYCQYSKFESTDNIDTKRIALEKCLFLSLYMRNFKTAQKYVSMLKHNFQNCQHVDDLWNEIEELLRYVKNQMNERKEKDIILYWLDGIPYGDECEMPYLQDVMKNSVVFENAFTYVANTHPTMRAMFLGKRDIDDGVYNIHQITRDISPVIQYLEKKGYNLKIFSSYLDNVPWKFLSDEKYIYPYETFSEKLWGMISHTLSHKPGKTLYIIHAMDAHEPFMNSMIKDDNYKVMNERYRLSRYEIDRQLDFYNAITGENPFRIYMSDHGRKQDTIHDKGKLRFHMLFNIYHQNLQPKRITGLFSILDFGMIIKQIIEKEEINEIEFNRDYVEIGQLDWYNRQLIEEICRNKIGLPILCFGYKGVVDQEYIYVRYKFGKEWLQRRDALPDNPQLFYDCDTDICDVSLLPHYRKLVSKYPESMEQDEQLQYSKYLYKIYQNILSHNDIAKRVKVINQILSQYTDRSVGIRMGGKHSEMLYECLTEENRQKIWGFIDNNQECICSRFHLPVIKPERLNKERSIKAVLLSSFEYLDMLRTESSVYRTDMTVLDLYRCYEENGIICTGNFWEPYILDEDYDVGFPFKEEN